MLDVALTVFAGAASTTPAARDVLSWDEFCGEVESLCSEESASTDKRDLIAFGPYRLRAGASRSNAAVERMAAVAAIDVDGCDLPPLRARLRELKCSAVVHGSPSDGSNCTRKMRVYVALDREYAPGETAAVRDSVAALLGVTTEWRQGEDGKWSPFGACPNSRDPNRLFFIGRLAGTPPRYVERFDGAPLVIAELPAVPPPPPRPSTPSAPRESSGEPCVVASAGVDIARSVALSAMLAALPRWEECEGSKHAICGAVGGVLRKSSFTRDECASLLRAWLPVGDPSVDVEHGIRWACSAWNRTTDEVSGEAALVERIGAERTALFSQGALLPWRARMETPLQPAASTALGEYTGLLEVDRAQPPPIFDYIVVDLGLAPGKVSAIQGFAYAGKSPFALLLATCIGSGLPFLGMPVKQCVVAYLDFEGGALTEQRDARICAGLGLDRASVPLHLFHSSQAFSEAMVVDTERLICDRGVTTLFVDTYSSALPADFSTFNEAAFRVWATELGRLSDRTGVCIIILVHENKGARGEAGLRGISGHGSLAGGVQAAIALDRPNEDAPNVIEVRCARAPKKAFATFAVRWDDVDCPGAPEGQSLVATRVTAEKKTRAPAVKRAARKAEVLADTRVSGERVMASMQNDSRAFTACELRDRAGANRNATNEALARLTAAKLMTMQGDHYSLTAEGRSADDVTIARALGETAPGFQR